MSEEFNVYKYIGVHTGCCTVKELVGKYKQQHKQLQAYKDKEEKLREYLKDLKEDALKDLSEVKIKYAFDCIIFALNKILDGSDE